MFIIEVISSTSRSQVLCSGTISSEYSTDFEFQSSTVNSQTKLQVNSDAIVNSKKLSIFW